MENISSLDDWEILTTFLPGNWEEKANELGALQRKRQVKAPSDLLRVLLIHLADGKSLRTTSALAKQKDICQLSDTGVLHRLVVSSDWLKWMAMELLNNLRVTPPPEAFERKFRIRLIDGSNVSEPGSTGSDWRIHYSLQWPYLACDTFKITSIKTGETFKNYPVDKGDLLVGDRVYCTTQGIRSVKERGGEVLVRFHSTNLPLKNRQGSPFPVLPNLRGLKDGRSGDWDVWFVSREGSLVKGRLCALRKSKEAIAIAKKQLKRTASKQGRKLRPETLEYAEYVILFTTVSRRYYSKKNILSLYRGRWQIELVFKRLKGIIGIGHLPKFDPTSCKAWLYGKMLVALLVENLHREAELFSPWGYPICQPTETSVQR